MIKPIPGHRYVLTLEKSFASSAVSTMENNFIENLKIYFNIIETENPIFYSISAFMIICLIWLKK
jgi:hypothetical protein